MKYVASVVRSLSCVPNVREGATLQKSCFSTPEAYTLGQNSLKASWGRPHFHMAFHKISSQFWRVKMSNNQTSDASGSFSHFKKVKYEMNRSLE